MKDGPADHQAARVTGERLEGERRSGMRAVGDAVSRVAAPLVARSDRGVLSHLKVQWTAAVGADLALLTWPEALGRGGVLKLRVAPSFALELQHRTPQVIERINGYFGRAAVTRLVLLQASPPLAGLAAGIAPTAPTAGEERELDARLAEIADPQLRAALAGLGRLVFADRGRG